jgi:HD superfamily phosphohydrolase
MIVSKRIRDVIHEYIEVPDIIINNIIDSPTFQRLRFIIQNGMAFEVYPNMRHTRFEHSLGAYNVMKKAVSILTEKVEDKDIKDLINNNSEELQVLALLHDIGHYPFSHTFEMGIKIASVDIKELQGLSKYHEKVGLFVVKNLFPKYADDFDKIYNSKDNLYSELLNNNIDVDRMDYLLRDSYYSGTPYGNFSLERMLSIMTLVKDNGKIRLAFSEKGISDLEHFLLARYYMYDQLYHHRVVEGFNAIMAMAISQLIISNNTNSQQNSSVSKIIFFQENEFNLDTFLNLTDYWLLSTLKNSNINECLKEAIFNRKKYMFIEIPLRYAEERGMNRIDVTKLLESKLYNIVKQYNGEVVGSVVNIHPMGESEIYIVNKKGEITTLTSSPIYQTLKNLVKSKLVIGICSKLSKEEVMKEIKNSLGID